MELEDKIKQFISVRHGNGHGNGIGFGLISGDGNGVGFGYASGRGDGCYSGRGFGKGKGDGRGNSNGFDLGYGDGSGDGDGNGIKSINGMSVHEIDAVPTIITSIRGNYAKGYVLIHNVNLKPCYVAKCGDFFAHGETLKQAQADAKGKYNQNRPLEDRIADFISQYPTIDAVADNADLFRWHNILTGSCEFGRKSFCKERGINWNKGTTTIREFINLCKDAYGGDAIEQLLKGYDISE